MANQVITDTQKATADLYNSLSTTVDTYLKQKEAIYNQCTGDFSRVNVLLKDAPDSVKKYYEAVAHQYRCEYANIRPGEREIEAWIVGDIFKDKQRADWWEMVGKMSSEEIAYQAGKFTAETILTDGVVRVTGSALQVVRLEGGTLYQATKDSARGIVTAVGEKTAQIGEKITLTADQIGTKIAERTAEGSTRTIAAADTGSIFKATIKNPGVADACEKIAANPPKMELVKEAGKAGAQAVKKANKEATLAGTTLKLPENVVKAMEKIAEKPVKAEIIKEAEMAGVQTATREAISLAGYDASLGNLKKLEEAANMFKNNASAISKDGPLTRLLKCGKVNDSAGNLASARGAGYELQKAYDLAKTGEKIIGFGTKIGGREFDIETATKLIECKNWDWSKVAANIKDKIGQQLGIAKSVGKSFELHSKNSVPEDLARWFASKGIKVVEG